MNDKQAEAVKQGSKLAMAYKSPSGQVILGVAITTIEGALVTFLDPRVSDADVLVKRHEALGVKKAFELAEHQIKLATGIAARAAAKSLAQGSGGADALP